MVSHDDVERLDQHLRAVKAAIQTCREIHALMEKNSNVPDDPTAYTDAQADLQEALTALFLHTNGMLDRTDTYDPHVSDPGRGGSPSRDSEPVTLPAPAVERGQASANLPVLPGSGGGGSGGGGGSS